MRPPDSTGQTPDAEIAKQHVSGITQLYQSVGLTLGHIRVRVKQHIMLSTHPLSASTQRLLTIIPEAQTLGYVIDADAQRLA